MTDIVSSSAIKLHPSLGMDRAARDRAYQETILQPHNDVVRTLVETRGGRILKGTGDGFFAFFASPSEAVRTCVDIQRRLEAEPIQTPFGPLEIHVGIHTGFPLEGDGDAQGTDMDYAARVAALAAPSQILVSPATFPHVRDMTDVRLRSIGQVDLKNIERAELHAVEWGARLRRSIAELLSGLVGLGFTWEPETFDAARPGRVFWPVRLREPAPIHAVQCFVAASLQRAGLDIELWIDELGTRDYDVDNFRTRLQMWFERPGGDSRRLLVRHFGEVTSGHILPIPWTEVRGWLGNTEKRLGQVLQIAKLWPDDSRDLASLANRRPRRLLSAPVAWTCLVAMAEAGNRPQPILTLGGHDERDLWRAWRDNLDRTRLSVGHLYVPELHETREPGIERLVHMARTPLAWRSRHDIEAAFNGEVEASEGREDWLGRDRLIPWCEALCVILPQYLADDTEPEPRKFVRGTVFSSRPDRDAALADLVEKVAKWLL